MDNFQQRDLFLLVAKQLQVGANLAEQAADNDFSDHTSPHRTAAHLLGMASYVTELMDRLQKAISNG